MDGNGNTIPLIDTSVIVTSERESRDSPGAIVLIPCVGSKVSRKSGTPREHGTR